MSVYNILKIYNGLRYGLLKRLSLTKICVKLLPTPSESLTINQFDK